MVVRKPIGRSLFFASLPFVALLLIYASPAAPAATIVSGPIESDTTWTLAASPYVVANDVTVNAGVTLTVEPGVVVKFQASYCDLVAQGRLLAQGTEAEPIVFTSYRDDAHGGDTNGDGGATTPAPNDWGGVVLTASSEGSVLEQTWIGYGGTGGVPYAYANLHLYTSDVTVQNNTIARSYRHGIHVGGVDPAHPLVLTGNTFLNNVESAVYDDVTGTRTGISLASNTSTGSPYNGYRLSGAVAGEATFSSPGDLPFIVWDSLTNLSVDAGSTLAFSPGTVVKFTTSRMLSVNGRLLAQGTEAQPIVFTSYRDDAHGGDTNGDGGATTPAPNDWTGIGIAASSEGSVLEQAWIGYGGYGNVPYAYANLHLYTSDVTVRNNTIARSYRHGIHVGGVDPAHPLVLTGNTFLNNVESAVYDDVTGTRTDISLASNTSTGSPYNGYRLKGAVAGEATFSSPGDLPFIVWDSLTNLSVDAGSTLAFSPGTVVKFTTSRMLLVNGRLLAQGTEAQPIVFTSYRDDAHGGDTNGDGGATTPAPNDWTGIGIAASSEGSVLEQAWIGYGGYGNVPYAYANLHLYTSDVTVRNNTIAWSAARGITVGAALPRIEGNRIHNNQVGIYCLDGALPRIWDNIIEANSQYGVQNVTSGITVDARGNWWGDASGPRHPSSNPGGLGNAVSDRVAFAPWYSEFEWRRPFSPVLHGLQPLSWGTFGSTAGMAVDVAFRGDGDWSTLGTGLLPDGGLEWDTAVEPDGWYDLRAELYDAGAQLLTERLRKVLVLNAPGIEWHGGLVTTSETWSAGILHLVGQDVTLGAGVAITVEAGVIKFAPDAGLIIPTGATLKAVGAPDAPIVFTSLADDSVGGDTNLDGSLTLPRPGDWRGVVVVGAGQADLNEYAEVRYAQVSHAGTLSGDATWSGSIVHLVTGEVTVPDGATLTVEPGAVVKFAPVVGITVQAGGHLVAEGTAAQPVTFTSNRDDAVGGDSNYDGDMTAPAAGDWRGILVDGGQASVDHAVLSYGAGSAGGWWDATAGSLSLRNGGQITAANSLIREAFFDGLIAWGSGQMTVDSTLIVAADRGVNGDGTSTVTLRNCTLDDNRIGVWAHGGTLQIRNTIVANSLEAGIDQALASSLAVGYSDVWSASGVNYRNYADQTGLNGNVSVDPQFRDRAQGNYRLGYVSPAIDAADGTAAPETDLMGAPRYDDPRTPNTGLPALNGAYPDMGAYEFVESAASNIDLVVLEVRGPMTATAGEQAAVSWTVANLGTEPAAGPWHDTVALGSGAQLTPTLLVAAEPLVGEGVVLGPGGSAQFSAEVRVPGGVLGDYHWYVQTNSGGEVFEGQNCANNLGASAGTVTLDVPELPVGGPALSGQFAAAGEPHWFRFQRLAGQDVLVSLDSESIAGEVELYLARTMPSRLEYEARSQEWDSPDASVVAAVEISATYYLLAYPRSLPEGPAGFSVRATILGFSVTAVEPRTVGTAGLVTLQIEGGGLVPGTQFSLVAGNGARVAAQHIAFVDSSRAYAAFDLTGFPAGPADVEAVQDGTTATAEDAVQVEAGGQGEFYTELTGPSVLRLGRSGTWYITYGNRGLVDVALPLLQFSAPGAQEIHVFDQPRNLADSFVLLALDQESRLGSLRPGSEETVAVKVLPALSGAPLQVTLGVMPGDAAAQSTTPLAWDSIPVPPDVDPAVWQAELDSLGDRLGETVGEYYALLMKDLDAFAADRLPYAYVANVDGRWLLGREPVGVPEVKAGTGSEANGGFEAAVDIPRASQRAPDEADGVRRTVHAVFCVSDYSQSGAPNLQGVARDYADLMDYIKRDLRTPDSRVLQFHDEIGNAADNLTANDIVNAIKGLRGTVDADDNLVIWFSGHGTRSATGESALVVNNGGQITVDMLQEAIDVAEAGRTFPILDACHAGGMEMVPSQTELVGVYATTAEKYAHADPATGSDLIKELKAGLRQGKSFLQAYEEAYNAIKARFGGLEDYASRQTPVLWNPRNAQVTGNPWEDPTGFYQVLHQDFAGLPFWVSNRSIPNFITSGDPNDKVGPAGAGLQAYVGFDPLLAYTIHFENVVTATAPAQEVVVTDVLDPHLDPSTLELDTVTFNDVTLEVPPGRDNFQAEAHVGSDPNPVQVVAELDYDTRTITWVLRSVDPATGELPEDPYAGFLPPNDAEHHGEGSVSFRVRAQPGLADGTQITNQAEIVFDVNAPIWTNVVTNTIGLREWIYLPLLLR